ncbi:MAG TPA: hypothetical protein VM889_02300 [Candidatus Thermoplasmatota archaeon]|nr:hypothetical protein [Candidatus Thermoplasmatota archaeon]
MSLYQWVPRSGKVSAHETARAARRHVVFWGGAAFALLAWAASPFAPLGASLGLLGLGAFLALLAVAPRARREPGAPRFLLDAGLAVVAVGLALLAGAMLAAAAPGFVPRGAPAVAAAALAALALLVVAGVASRALALGLDVGGASPRAVPFLAALVARDPRDLLAPPRLGGSAVVPGAVSAAFEAAADFALVVVDGALAPFARLAARLAGRDRERLHAAGDLGAVARALEGAGLRARVEGRVLVVAMGGGDEPSREVFARTRRLLFPRVEADALLDLSGPPRDVIAVRRALESLAAFDLAFAWSREARRLESRLNALARASLEASTMEDRATLLDEAERLEASARARSLAEDEWSLLAGWKGAGLRAALAERMARDPLGGATPGLQVAPGAVLPANLGAVVETGGLAALGRLVYVPYFVVPVATPAGELDVAVNAFTGFDPADSEAVLARFDAEGASHLVESERRPTFIQLKSRAPGAKSTSEALAAAFGGKPSRYAPLTHAATVLNVPFVEMPGGVFASAVTGATHETLAARLPSTLPPGVLVE